MLYRKDKERLQAALVVLIVWCVLISGSIGIYLVINWLLEVIFGAQQAGNNLRRVMDFGVSTVFIITFIFTYYKWLIKGKFRK